MKWALACCRQVQASRSASPSSKTKKVEGVKMPAAWLDAVVGSGKVSQLALPVIIPVTEFRDIYGVGLTNMIGGAGPARNSRRQRNNSHPFWRVAG